MKSVEALRCERLLKVTYEKKDLNNLQPSSSLGPSKGNSVDANIVVESITDYGCYSRAKVKFVDNSSASQSQNEEVITIIFWKYVETIISTNHEYKINMSC